MSIYFQLIFLSNLEEFSRLGRVSIDINLISIDFPLNLEEFSRLGRVSIDINLLSIDFPLKPRRILKVRKGFN